MGTPSVFYFDLACHGGEVGSRGRAAEYEGGLKRMQPYRSKKIEEASPSACRGDGEGRGVAGPFRIREDRIGLNPNEVA